MALINCPECGRQVSDRAVACPNCGFPLEEVPRPSPTTALRALSSIDQMLPSHGDGATETADEPSSLGPRILAVTAGIVAHASWWSLATIVFYSQVDAGLKWIPGFGILALGVLFYVMARVAVLKSLEIDPETKAFSKPIQSMVDTVTGVIALVAGVVMYVVLTSFTSLDSWQGDLPLISVD